MFGHRFLRFFNCLLERKKEKFAALPRERGKLTVIFVQRTNSPI